MIAKTKKDRTAWLACVYVNGNQVASKWFNEEDKHTAISWIFSKQFEIDPINTMASSSGDLREWNREARRFI